MAKSKYIYVEVTFISNSQRYSYRADNVTVHVGDVVVVPTPKGDNFATVERIRRFTDKNASYPPEQTKNIVKVVGHRIRTNLSDVDMRAPMDISTTVKKTLFGEKTVVISRKERDALRSRFARSNMRLVEYYPVSMVGQVVRENGKQIIPPPNKPEDQQGKPAKWLLHSHLFSKEYECSYCHVCYDNHFSICPNCRKHMDLAMEKAPAHKIQVEKTAYWTEAEHLWGDKTYKCSNCNTVYNKPAAYCPSCKCKMTKTKSDPVWVDEMADYDAMFED